MNQTKPFDYNLPENHILKRESLSPEIKAALLGDPRDSWSVHSNFDGYANFWLRIHNNLRGGSDYLVKGFQRLLDESESNLDEAVNTVRLKEVGANVVSFAHHHHEIEDHNYFPQFVQLYPNVEHAISLLDSDHRVLEEALNDTELALKFLQNQTADRDAIARAYNGCQALQSVFERHLWDEEEIIVPILLARF
jgi:hemerythrin-like domain-containing protein